MEDIVWQGNISGKNVNESTIELDVQHASELTIICRSSKFIDLSKIKNYALKNQGFSKIIYKFNSFQTSIWLMRLNIIKSPFPSFIPKKNPINPSFAFPILCSLFKPRKKRSKTLPFHLILTSFHGLVDKYIGNFIRKRCKYFGRRQEEHTTRYPLRWTWTRTFSKMPGLRAESHPLRQ